MNLGAALVELVAVVVGILLALWVNGWNQRRMARGEERDYLQLLGRDLDRDLQALQMTRGQLQSQGDAASLVRTFAAGGQAPREDLDAAASLLFLTFTYDQQRPTFLSLRDGGNLRVIGDPELRSSVTDYYEVSQEGLQAFVNDYRIAHRRLRVAIGRHAKILPAPEFESIWPLPEDRRFAQLLSAASDLAGDNIFWNELNEVGARCYELLDEIDRVEGENRALREGLKRAKD